METEVINTGDSSQDGFQRAKNRKGKRKANNILFSDIKTRRAINMNLSAQRTVTTTLTEISFRLLKMIDSPF